MLPKDSAVVRVLVFLNVIILIFTYPLTINPANSTLENMTVDKWFPRSGPKRKWAKNISRFLICFSAAYLGIELSDYLDKVIGLLGAVLCAPLALMLPTLCHLKLLAHKRGQKVEDLIVIIISLVAMLFCVVQTLSSWQWAIHFNELLNRKCK